MPEKRAQAEAYLREAETTLEGARILFENRDGGYAQVVKNAYDAFEQALSAGIASKGDSIPRSHSAKIQEFFAHFENDELERAAFEWFSRRSSAQYVDVRGSDLSVPDENFGKADAEDILDDADRIIQFATEQVREELGSADDAET